MGCEQREQNAMTSLANIKATAWSAPVSAQNTPREIDGVRTGAAKVIGKLVWDEKRQRLQQLGRAANFAI